MYPTTYYYNRKIKSGKGNNKFSSDQVISLIKSSDGYVIIYSDWCKFSQSALRKLEDKDAVKIDIDDLEVSFQILLDDLRKASLIPSSHTTRPIIFRKGKFIGGDSDLRM